MMASLPLQPASEGVEASGKDQSEKNDHCCHEADYEKAMNHSAEKRTTDSKPLTDKEGDQAMSCGNLLTYKPPQNRRAAWDQLGRQESHRKEALDALIDGSFVGVLMLHGSLCPVTLSHVQAFHEAKAILLGSSDMSMRHAPREKFSEILGFFRVTTDSNIMLKMQKAGYNALDTRTRLGLVCLAIEDFPWLSTENYGLEMLKKMERGWPNLKFIPYHLGGADCGKMTVDAGHRQIILGRSGYTINVEEIDLDAGHVIMGPDLGVTSSSAVRKSCANGDHEALESMVHPRVMKWLLQEKPF